MNGTKIKEWFKNWNWFLIIILRTILFIILTKFAIALRNANYLVSSSILLILLGGFLVKEFINIFEEDV